MESQYECYFNIKILFLILFNQKNENEVKLK